jgi:hypothetical protein
VHYLLINIPAPVEPIDRGERFEDPLFDALEAEGIPAEWLGGGSALAEVDGGMVIESCDIELEVEDVARALPIICRVLTAGGAPPNTTIRQFEPEEVIHRLGEER